MKKITLFITLLLISFSSFSQKTVHNYKYVIIPKKLEAFKKIDEYESSSIIKFLFNKNGYTAFFSDEKFPEDLAKDRCSALIVDLSDNSGLFLTKTTIKLRDCYNNMVFNGVEGKSNLKAYKRAYHNAIRESFKGIKNLNYKYVPLKEESKKLDAIVKKEPKKDLIKVEKKHKESLKPVINTTTKDIIYDLFASYSNTGYVLKNSKENIVFEILRTSNPEIFIIKNKNGVLIKKNENTWMSQYYVGERLTMKPVKIKFN